MFTNPQALAPDVWLLQRFVNTQPLMAEIERVTSLAPFRHMTIPGGGVTKAALSNTGALGWTSTAFEYRYRAIDPDLGKPWPNMPAAFRDIGQSAAAAVGYTQFEPDACLINRYVAGAGMGLHQDKNERDFSQPIVSVSIGAPCRFVIGGLQRGDTVRSLVLNDGDVMVWGGVSRLMFHGVRPLAAGSLTRYNLTIRRAG